MKTNLPLYARVRQRKWHEIKWVIKKTCTS